MFSEALLEAGAAELRGVGTSAVARHVRACDRCAARAREILTATEELDGALSRFAGAEPDVKVILRRAGHAGPVSLAVGGLRRRWRWVTLAAAAVAAGVLLGPPGRRPAPTPAPPPAAEAATLPAVVAPASGSVAVIATADPKLTVVWFFRTPAPDQGDRP